MNNESEEKAGIGSGKLSGAALTKTEAAFVYLFVLTALEKLIAVYHARRLIREFIPIDGTSHQHKLQAAKYARWRFLDS